MKKDWAIADKGGGVKRDLDHPLPRRQRFWMSNELGELLRLIFDEVVETLRLCASLDSEAQNQHLGDIAHQISNTSTYQSFLRPDTNANSLSILQADFQNILRRKFSCPP